MIKNFLDVDFGRINKFSQFFSAFSSKKISNVANCCRVWTSVGWFPTCGCLH